ncbi:MAG: cardiolipin synthase [Deltaproteobacteria bacterium]|nr:cardiolipin synthase [Deltaproteobacteria bacterium]
MVSLFSMDISQWLIAHSLEIAGYLLAIILIPRILLERRHPGATIAWVLAIGLVPYLGVPLYFLIGGRRIKKISLTKDWGRRGEKPNPDLPTLEVLPADNQEIAQLLVRAGTFPPDQSNAITIIDDGIKAYDGLVNLLRGAQESIEVATFILGRDEVGRALVQILAQKAREGLEVRLLLDALGSLRARGRFVQPLLDAGGKVGIFLPLLPLRRRWSANLRNHRKMTVVDGDKAFLGGMNLAREYMGPRLYRNRWKDVSMMIAGPGARYVRNIFWQDWRYSTDEPIPPGVLCPVPQESSGDGSILQVVGDGPDVPERPLYSGVLAALNRARKSIWVVTPYFVPDDALSAALALAARMGCDVRLIMPEKSNHPLVDLAGHSFLVDLMHAGVRFFCYQPGMLHAKLIAIDERLAVVGSANMDIRSFQLNFEIATFLYDAQSVKEVLGVMNGVLKECMEIGMAEITRKTRLRRFSEDICRVFSPLF